MEISWEEEWHLSFPYVFDYDGQVNFQKAYHVYALRMFYRQTYECNGTLNF